jgi:hypothetical protein
MMDYRNKDQIKEVLREYERLPDADMLSKNLYDGLVDTCNNSNKEITNGEVMNTLKLMVIQMNGLIHLTVTKDSHQKYRRSINE